LQRHARFNGLRHIDCRLNIWGRTTAGTAG
jgi:hypothetical protein